MTPLREEEEYSLQPTCFSGQARTLSTHTYDQRGVRSSSPYLTIREDCGGNRSAQWLFALDPTHHTDIEYWMMMMMMMTMMMIMVVLASIFGANLTQSGLIFTGRDPPYPGHIRISAISVIYWKGKKYPWHIGNNFFWADTPPPISPLLICNCVFLDPHSARPAYDII